MAKSSIDKTTLITHLAELSILLGTEIEPASDVKALQQQIADAEQLLKSQSDDDHNDDQTQEPAAIEQTEIENTVNDDVAITDEPTVLVQATHTIWTQHQGERIVLLKGEQAMWPKDLAEDHAQNGHVILLGQ